MNGKLYIVALPIGNIRDISLRAIDILNFVDEILTEDTREFIKIAKSYNIETKVSSFHSYNEHLRHAEIIKKLEEGKNIALTSDRGLPALSDPGFKLISSVTNKTVIPGASSISTAAALIPLREFAFIGFVQDYSQYLQYKIPLIFFEAPHRMQKTLQKLLEYGDRRIVILREMTKIYEEIIDINLSKAQAMDFKGEITFVLFPNEDKAMDYSYILNKCKDIKVSSKDLANIIAICTNTNKNEVYRAIIDNKNSYLE